MREMISAGGTEFWLERRGHGPDVLLLAGLSDPAEAWQAQLDGLSDRYRVTPLDNPGLDALRYPTGRLSVAMMTDDAAALLRAFDVPAATPTCCGCTRRNLPRYAYHGRTA